MFDFQAIMGLVCVGLFLVLVLGLVLGFGLAWQRRALVNQESSMSQIDKAMLKDEERLSMVRKSIEDQERATAGIEELVQGQREIVQLLRRIAEQERSL